MNPDPCFLQPCCWDRGFLMWESRELQRHVLPHYLLQPEVAAIHWSGLVSKASSKAGPASWARAPCSGLGCCAQKGPVLGLKLCGHLLIFSIIVEQGALNFHSTNDASRPGQEPGARLPEAWEMCRGTEALRGYRASQSETPSSASQAAVHRPLFPSLGLQLPLLLELLAPPTVSPVLGKKHHVIAQEVQPAQGTAPASPGSGFLALGDLPKLHASLLAPSS